MTWIEACQDRSLQNLPYKVELNRQGKIILSPTRYKHGFYQTRIASALQTLLPQGRAAVESAIDTPGGTFVADVTWAALERFRINEEQFSCSIAPEICVEIWSMSNTPEELEMKRPLYFHKGALEFWHCDEKGLMTFFSHAGPLEKSSLCPDFPSQIEG
jgi:Uma2 family endonuclease